MTLNDEFEFNQLVRRIDDPHTQGVVLFLVDEDDNVGMVAKGVNNDEAFWSIIAPHFMPIMDRLIEASIAAGTAPPVVTGRGTVVLPTPGQISDIRRGHGRPRHR